MSHRPCAHVAQWRKMPAKPLLVPWLPLMSSPPLAAGHSGIYCWDAHSGALRSSSRTPSETASHRVCSMRVVSEVRAISEVLHLLVHPPLPLGIYCACGCGQRRGLNVQGSKVVCQCRGERRGIGVPCVVVCGVARFPFPLR